MKKIFVVLFVLLVSLFSQEIEFSDERGNLIKLEKPASRVISFPIPLASFSISVDNNADKLVSIHPLAKIAIQNGILGRIFPKTLDLQTNAVGSNFVPNVEEVIRLKPDIVFQWAHMSQKIVEPLQKIGINLVLLDYGDEKNAINWFKIIVKAYDLEHKVETILKNRSFVENQITTSLKNIRNRPKVLYFLRYKQAFLVSGKQTYQDYNIKLAGGINVASHIGQKTVNLEQILLYNPDIVLLNNFEQDLSPEDIYSNKFLKHINAVKNRAVYKIPFGGERWDPPSQESHLSWIWLNKIFYSKSSLNLKKEMMNSYNIFYNYNLNDSEILSILHYEKNKNSRYYEDILE